MRNTYLVGHSITLADVSLSCDLDVAFANVSWWWGWVIMFWCPRDNIFEPMMRCRLLEVSRPSADEVLAIAD